MSKQNDGGPAFPLHHVAGSDGMSLRDYFAAHAPEEQAKWFFPVMPRKPTAPWFTSDIYPIDFVNAINNKMQKWRSLEEHDSELAWIERATWWRPDAKESILAWIKIHVNILKGGGVMGRGLCQRTADAMAVGMG
jgi:hypothetical protein